MLRSDIPKVLFSSIKEDDPYRASKLFQIERWCYANWDLHKRGGKKRHNFLSQVLSNEDCSIMDSYSKSYSSDLDFGFSKLMIDFTIPVDSPILIPLS